MLLALGRLCSTRFAAATQAVMDMPLSFLQQLLTFSIAYPLIELQASNCAAPYVMVSRYFKDPLRRHFRRFPP